MELDRLVARFESLGDNCEFGLVQRWAGAEPLGLLRFAGLPGDSRLEDLVAGIECGFDGLGEPDSIEITIGGRPGDGDREYLIRESRYQLFYHTFLRPTDMAEAGLRKSEATRLRFLRRKLLADLASAEKIFIWKCNDPVEPPRIERLFAALRRYGPITLLWVCAEDHAPGRVGSVEQLAPGLLRGVIDRFAPYDDMNRISHDTWYAICANALRMPGAHTVADDADLTVTRASLRELARRYETDPSVGGIRAINVLAPAGAYTRGMPIHADTASIAADLLAASHHHHLDLRQGYDDVLKVVMERALVTGEGAVITRDGYLLDETCGASLDNGVAPYGLEAIGDARLRLAVIPTRMERDPALLLKRPWWRNYGRWLVDAIGLVAFAATRMDVFQLVLVIPKEEDPTLRATMLDLLGMIAPGARAREIPDDEVWRFSNLHYVTSIHLPPNFILSDAMVALRARILGDANGHPSGRQSDQPKRRLYVSQVRADGPRLENEAAVIELCATFGFEPVTPELHTASERVAMFAAAEAVVGAPVPQLANIAFCPASALVVALLPGGAPDPFHAALADRCGLRYAEIFGPVVEAGSDGTAGRFRIEPDQLRSVLDSLLPKSTLPNSTGLGKSSGQQAPVVAFEAFQPNVVYPDHQGEHYLAFLQHLHRMLRPRSYLEIGTQRGAALQLADCPSVAIDPRLMLEETALDPRPGLALFRMSSDTFFAQHDPATYLGGPIELAFLNGPTLHLEVMLRDFIAVERHATPQSVIVINHVVPPDIYMTTRDRLDGFRRSRSDHPDWWTGDVWKIIAVLQRYRPELTIDVFDAAPTGVAVIRGANPASATLSEHYARILEEVPGGPNEARAFAAYRAGVNLRATAALRDLLASGPRHTADVAA
jgi:capsular polysaccharide biosynthesis protein